MRTTLTLDSDVAALLARVRKRYPGKLRELLNEALRVGLPQVDAPPSSKPPFRTHAADLGEMKLPNGHSVAEMIAFGEGEDYK